MLIARSARSTEKFNNTFFGLRDFFYIITNRIFNLIYFGSAIYAPHFQLWPSFWLLVVEMNWSWWIRSFLLRVKRVMEHSLNYHIGYVSITLSHQLSSFMFNSFIYCLCKVSLQNVYDRTLHKQKSHQHKRPGVYNCIPSHFLTRLSFPPFFRPTIFITKTNKSCIYWVLKDFVSRIYLKLLINPTLKKEWMRNNLCTLRVIILKMMTDMLLWWWSTDYNQRIAPERIRVWKSVICKGFYQADDWALYILSLIANCSLESWWMIALESYSYSATI